MDILEACEAVATIIATGALQGLGEAAAHNITSQIVTRIRKIFSGNLQSTSTLNTVLANRCYANYIGSLAEILHQHAEMNHEFSAELIEWANKYAPHTTTTIQKVRARRDAYTAGRNITIVHNDKEPRSE